MLALYLRINLSYLSYLIFYCSRNQALSTIICVIKTSSLFLIFFALVLLFFFPRMIFLQIFKAASFCSRLYCKCYISQSFLYSNYLPFCQAAQHHLKTFSVLRISCMWFLLPRYRTQKTCFSLCVPSRRDNDHVTHDPTR